ncbi:MAG: FtsX-like permease family protein [Actinomycetota bacterium]|nr:FtsX-like permease family protein [Actinomycetota bacterium]
MRTGLRVQWRGWAAITVVIAVAGGTVLATAAGARRTDTSYARFLRASRGADVLVAPFVSSDSPGVPGFYSALAELPGVATVGRAVGISALDSGRGNAPIQMVAAGDASLTQAVERPKITAGRMFDPSRADEAVVETELARRLQLRAGSVLNLLVGPTNPAGFQFDRAKPVVIRIVGVGVTRDSVVSVNAQAAQPVLRVTPALLRQLSETFASRDDFVAFEGAYVRLRKGVSVAAFGQTARELATRHLGAGSELFVADERQQAAKVEGAIRPEAVALGVFALLVALAGLLVTGQLLSRQLFVGSTENPALRALGMSRGQLTALGLGQVGAVAGAGAVLSAVIAALASPLMPIGPARIAEPRPGVELNWAVLGLGAFGIVVLGVLRVAWRAWRLASAPDQGAGAQLAGQPSPLVGALTRAGVPVSAAVGTGMALLPGRGRTAVPVRSAVAGTALALAAVAAALTFGDNLVRLVDTPRLYGQAWDLAIDAQFGTIPLTQANQALARESDVEGWTFGNHHVVSIAGRETPAIGLVAGRGPITFPTLVQGRVPQSPDEIVLGTRTLEASGARVGDTISVAFQGGDAPRTMRVVGRAVFPLFGQGSFTPTGLGEGAALLDPPPSQDGVNFFLAVLSRRGGEAPNAALVVRNLIASGLCPADQDCPFVTAQRPADVKNYARIQRTPLALAGVLALLGVATVAHVLVTSIRRRRRDFAVLKTLGFTRTQVSGAVAWQATVLVLLALVVGLPIGVAAGRWSWQFFSRWLGVTAETHVPVLAVLGAVPVALLVANAVAAVPGWVAGRLRPGTVLRTE